MALAFALVMYGEQRLFGRLTTTIEWPKRVKEIIARDYMPPRVVFDLYGEPEIIAFVERLSADEIRAGAAKAAKGHGVKFVETRMPDVEWHFTREALEVSVRVKSREQPTGGGH